MPVHLRPSAPTAPDAILCGDPARALAIAQEVLVEPRMSNHHRGLWGYHGVTAAGRELTVQSTGIGGPSAAVVLREVAGLGVRRAIRVGTCRAASAAGSPGPNGAAPLAGAVTVEIAIAADGTSAALGAGTGTALRPDRALTAALLDRAGGSGVVRSTDLYYGPGGGEPDGPGGGEPDGPGGGEPASPGPSGPPAVEDLQTAPLLALGQELGVRVAAALVVAVRGGVRLEDDPLERAVLGLAGAAAAALAATP